MGPAPARPARPRCPEQEPNGFGPCALPAGHEEPHATGLGAGMALRWVAR